MPTARLPDINSSFLRHRGEFLDAARHGDDRRALAAFHARNALLPADLGDDNLPAHRVLISDSLYAEKHRHQIVAKCPNCGALHSKDSVKFLNVRLTAVERALSGRRQVRLWYCRPDSLLPPEDAGAAAPEGDPTKEFDQAATAEESAAGAKPGKRSRRKKSKPAPPPPTCGRSVRADRTEFEDRHPAEPYLCGVIPSPPKRRTGLGSRTPYKQEFFEWAALAHAELEGRSAEYRDAHWKRAEDEDGGLGGKLAALFGDGPSLESQE